MFQHVTWFALASLLLAIKAHASEPTDPSPLKRMGAGTITSRCVGMTDTPLCAAETFLSCLVRADHRHCAAVGAPPLTMYPLPGFREYRVVSVDTVLDDARWMTILYGAFPPGSVRVTLQERACPSSGCTREPWEETEVFVQRSGAAWSVTRWESAVGLRGQVSARRVTSRCLGDLRSPVCIIESVFACVMRGAYDLCRRANLELQQGLCFRKPDEEMFYEIMELAFERRDRASSQIEIADIGGGVDECTRGTPDCFQASFGYRLRRQGNAWRYEHTWRAHIEGCGGDEDE